MIIGLPESFNSDSLQEICEVRILCALGISTPCIVERTCRLGGPSNEKHIPCHILVRYLNYSDRVYPEILALYQKGVKFTLAYPAILNFTDPSGDSKKKSHPEDQYLRHVYIFPWTLPPRQPYLDLPNQGISEAQGKTMQRNSDSRAPSAETIHADFGL